MESVRKENQQNKRHQPRINALGDLVMVAKQMSKRTKALYYAEEQKVLAIIAKTPWTKNKMDRDEKLNCSCWAKVQQFALATYTLFSDDR
jgi:hypothetical protein